MKKILGFLLLISLLIPSVCLAKTELYVIYQKDTGKIITSGRVNRERDQSWIDKGDTSTTYGSILKKLKDTSLAVKYFKNQPLPNGDKKINIISKEITNKSPEDFSIEAKEKQKKELQNRIDKLNKIINAQAEKDKLQQELDALQN